MRIVALDAVANRWRMDGPFQRCSILIGVARDAERLGRRRDQFHAGDVFIGSDLMACEASHGDGGVDELAFRFILVALEALRRVDVLIEGNRVNRSGGTRTRQHHHAEENQYTNTEAAFFCDLLAEPDAMGEQSHVASERCVCTNLAVLPKRCCKVQHSRNLLNQGSLIGQFATA